MDNDISLASLRAFRAIAREGSFAAAANTLRIPKSTLSKRISDLEEQLGVRVIERTTRRLRITQEGEILLIRAERLLGEADDLRRALGETVGAAKGHLRIAVPPVLGQLTMGPIAARFRRTFPEVTLEIHFINRPPNLLEEGFDGAIRFGEIEDSGAIARLLGRGRSVVVAAPEIASAHPVSHPDALQTAPMVGVCIDLSFLGPQVLHNGNERAPVPRSEAIRLGSFSAVRDAAIAGAGFAVLPEILAAPEIRSGRLVQILPDWATPLRPYYFVYPSAHSLTVRLRAFIDMLREEFS